MTSLSVDLLSTSQNQLALQKVISWPHRSNHYLSDYTVSKKGPRHSVFFRLPKLFVIIK